MKYKEPDTYVKINNVESYKNLNLFNFTGYGWIVKHDLDLKDNTIYVACEDEYLGCRAYRVKTKDIEICKTQKSF